MFFEILHVEKESYMLKLHVACQSYIVEVTYYMLEIYV